MSKKNKIYKEILHVRVDAATKSWYENFNTVDWIKEHAGIEIDENTSLSERVSDITKLYDILEGAFKDLKEMLVDAGLIKEKLI